ncbi:hypothetical protein ACFE04_009090 [Oxalis oulophora]
MAIYILSIIGRDSSISSTQYPFGFQLDTYYKGVIVCSLMMEIEAKRRFVNHNNISDSVRTEVLDQFELELLEEPSWTDFKKIAVCIPTSLKVKISKEHFNRSARTIYLFNDISYTSLDNIAIKTEIRYFNPGEYLIIRNEFPNFLFLLLQGQVELMDVKAASNEQENNVRLNACCGALGVLFNENQPYTIRARSNSMILRLGANDFGDSIRHTTRDYVILYYNIFWNLNTYTSGDLYNYVTQKENSIVDGTLPLQFKLIIAARHHAAASGNKKCLVYAHQLVKEHMDINTHDTTGSIPIWEALLHGHYDLAQHMSERMSANLNAGTVHQFLVKAVELSSPIRVRKMIDLGMDVNLIREGEGGHHVVRIASQRNRKIYNMLEQFLNGGPLAAAANN